MIFALDKRGKCHPDKLPCGCRVIGNLKAIGLDDEPIEGISALNSKTGWMKVQRHVVFPALRKTRTDGRSVTTEMGMQVIQVIAPFELKCKVHGPIAEAP